MIKCDMIKCDSYLLCMRTGDRLFRKKFDLIFAQHGNWCDGFGEVHISLLVDSGESLGQHNSLKGAQLKKQIGRGEGGEEKGG